MRWYTLYDYTRVVEYAVRDVLPRTMHRPLVLTHPLQLFEFRTHLLFRFVSSFCFSSSKSCCEQGLECAVCCVHRNCFVCERLTLAALLVLYFKALRLSQWAVDLPSALFKHSSAGITARTLDVIVKAAVWSADEMAI